MGLFDTQISFIDDLENQMFRVLRDAIDQHDNILKNYVVEKQLYDRGVDGNEKRLKGYTRQTIRYKISKGQPADRTTLKDEGDFHLSLMIDAFDDRFEVSSNIGHAKYLIKRYGEDIVRPTVQNMKEFFEDFFIPYLKQYINGRFAR